MRPTWTVSLTVLFVAGPALGQTTHPIAADSIVPSAPVGTLSDLLTDRAPGLLVMSRDGSAGAGTSVSLRGASEPVVSSQPLLYIDGVRVDNRPGGDNPVHAGVPGTGRFNDIDPAEIAHVEILPASAASTLYGPGAGNGVVLVTTRRGTSASAWSGHVTAEGGLTTTSLSVAPSYGTFGTNGTSPCVLFQVAAGQCQVDSVTSFNPLLASATTPVATGNIQRVGANVSLRRGPVRGFLSGHYGYTLGDLSMAEPDIVSYETTFQAKPGRAQLQPNAADRSDIRGTIATDVGSRADAALMIGYSVQHQRAANVDALFTDAATGPGARQAGNDGWGPDGRPATLFAEYSAEYATHITASATAHWRPIEAIVTHAALGVDGVDQTGRDTSVVPPLTASSKARDRQVSAQYSGDLGATLDLAPAPWVGVTSDVGLQYLDQHFRSMLNFVTLCPSCGMNNPSVPPTDEWTHSAYADEGIRIADRMALSAGVRWDHERLSGTRTNLSSTSLNPSVRGSVVLAGTLADPRLRVRGALGQSTRLPSAQEYEEPFLDCPFPITTVIGVSAPPPPPCGQPRAERQRETEIGLDAAVPGGRVMLEVTAYQRRNSNVVLPTVFLSSGAEGRDTLGSGVTRDYGVEGAITVRPIVTRAVTWDATLSANTDDTRFLRGLTFPFTATSGNPVVSNVIGYPVNGVWAAPYTYTDANHNGVIDPNEVGVFSDDPVFVGPSTPTRRAALSTMVALFRGRLTIATVADYSGGYVLPDESRQLQGEVLTSRALVIPGASLAAQAAVLSGPFSTAAWEHVNALRWRELSVSTALPVHRDVRVTLAARNLALKTNYTGGDPDQDITYNEALLRMPQPRTWLLRVSAGF